MEEFKAVGISYHHSPLEIRESVTLNEAEGRTFLMRMKETLSVTEALVISTCNRTEIYYSSGKDLSEELISLISIQKALSSSTIRSYFKTYQTTEAVAHLFDVSLGLDAQVLGDIQISNQVKRAYQMSADLEMAGPFLHRLMHTIFFANKRVVQETTLQDGSASVASVATDLISGFIRNISSPRIALVGLGEIGQNVLENLGGTEASICLINRTRSKAEKLANAPNISTASFSDLHRVVAESDVIISAISADRTILSPDHFSGTLHKLLVDLSVPRSISPDTDAVPGIMLYNIDQLSKKATSAQAVRAQAIPQAKAIIQEAISGFDQWKEEMEVSPTIQKLKSTLEKIRKEELARHSSGISEEQMDLLNMVTKSMIQKVIKLPVLQLKAACKRGEAETLVGVLNDLFNLEPREASRNDPRLS